MNTKALLSKRNIPKLCLMALTAILITITGVYYKQELFFMIPIYVSLVVGLLQTAANRYSMLIGGLNSILYTIVYISIGLYASAAQAFFFSCLFQLSSFLLWTKNKYAHSTQFRKMSWGIRGLLAIGFAIISFVVSFILNEADSAYQVLDSVASVLGAFVSVLTMFAFVEYTWLMLPSGIINILLNLSTMAERPAQITYVIFSIYSLICVTQGFFSVRKLYREQQNIQPQ